MLRKDQKESLNKGNELETVRAMKDKEKSHNVPSKMYNYDSIVPSQAKYFWQDPQELLLNYQIKHFNLNEDVSKINVGMTALLLTVGGITGRGNVYMMAYLTLSLLDTALHMFMNVNKPVTF